MASVQIVNHFYLTVVFLGIQGPHIAIGSIAAGGHVGL